MKASIGIFQKSADKTEVSTQPEVPDELFEAVQRVIQNKTTELVKAHDCMYVVLHSISGPFSAQIGDEWLPVYIAKVLQWTSGGVKDSELQKYLNNKENDKTP